MKAKADYTVDVRGTISPFSLLKVSMVFQQMKPNQIVEVVGCDDEMQRDLVRLLPRARIEIVRPPVAELNAEVSIVRFCKTEQAP